MEGAYTATVVIPAFNEEAGLSVVLEQVCAAVDARPIQVLVVDDGSTDATAEVAAGFRCTLIRHPVNLGKGAAMSSGVASAEADHIVFVDGDGSYPVEALVEIVARLNEYDMVVATRKESAANNPAVNRLGNAAFGWMIRRLYGLRRNDPLTGLYGIRRQHYQRMRVRSRGFGIEAEIAIKAAEMGLSVLEIPTEYRPRIGEKKLRVMSDGVVVLRTIWRLLALFNPIAVFFVPGVAVTVVGTALAVAAFASSISVGGIGLASASGVLAGMVALLGIQMMVFGIAGAAYAQAHWYTRPSRLTSTVFRSGVRNAFGLAGLALAAAGLVASTVFALPWAAGGFNGAVHLRLGIVGVEAMVGGIEIFLSMAFLGLFGDALGDPAQPEVSVRR